MGIASSRMSLLGATATLLGLATFPHLASGATSLLASHYNGNIYTLSFSDAGQLSIAGQISSGARMPSWLEFDAEGKVVYVTDEATYGSPTLTSFTVAADGKLTRLAQARAPGGELHSTLYGGADGKGFLAAAEYDPSSIVTFKLPLQQSTQAQQRLKFTMTGRGTVPSRQNAPHPHSTFPDLTGQFLLSADLGADVIRIFRVNPSTGMLTECPSAAATPGDGPRHGSFWSASADPSDTSKVMLYTVNELSNSVSAWAATYPASATGCLTIARRQTISNYGPGRAAPRDVKAAEVHVVGNFVYASNRNDKTFGATQDSIGTYSIDPSTGAITFIELANAYAYFPRTFEFNRERTLVAVGGQTSASVAIVERNTTTGRLGRLVATINVGQRGNVNQEDGLSHVIWND